MQTNQQNLLGDLFQITKDQLGVPRIYVQCTQVFNHYVPVQIIGPVNLNILTSVNNQQVDQQIQEELRCGVRPRHLKHQIEQKSDNKATEKLQLNQDEETPQSFEQRTLLDQPSEISNTQRRGPCTCQEDEAHGLKRRDNNVNSNILQIRKRKRQPKQQNDRQMRIQDDEEVKEGLEQMARITQEDIIDQHMENLDIQQEIFQQNFIAHKGKKVPSMRLITVQADNEKRDGNYLIRSEVIFKTVIRDMRQFYSNNFNMVTDFKNKKLRHKCRHLLFCQSLKKFVCTSFEELSAWIQLKPQTVGITEGLETAVELNMDNLIFFLGALIYPKQIMNKSGDILKALKDHKYETMHDFLYKFSTAKLHELVQNKFFAYFYCFYYEQSVMDKQNLFKKIATRDNNINWYIEAANNILQHCKLTLKLKQNDLLGPSQNQMLTNMIHKFIFLEERPFEVQKSQKYVQKLIAKKETKQKFKIIKFVVEGKKKILKGNKKVINDGELLSNQQH